MNFVELRYQSTAQWEIREYTKMLKELLFGIYPKTTDSGPIYIGSRK
jgi:thymidylate synthase ThyX